MTALPPLAALRRFVPGKRTERCELCSVPLASGHPHLLEIATRRIVCACDPCSILFDRRGAAQYRRIGREVRFLPDFQMSDAEWDALRIPIGLAYFVAQAVMPAVSPVMGTFSNASDDTAAAANSGKLAGPTRIAAFYPSPAGPTEALLPLDAWSGIEERNPVLRNIEPDVAALLVNRIGADREHYLTPIDRCYQLVGLIRTRWRGLGGGEEVWAEIGRFFADLKEAGRA